MGGNYTRASVDIQFCYVNLYKIVVYDEIILIRIIVYDEIILIRIIVYD
jgi:hypothetical protein